MALNRSLTLLVGVSMLALCLCAAPIGSASAQTPRRVLFVGNSLTVANDLPRLVEQESLAAGSPFVATVVAFPNVSLGDHWDRGDALTAIRTGGWYAVVLQQGPSSLAESRAVLIADTRRFDAEIKRVGARTALFMVWPPKERIAFFGDVARSYREAAEAVHGLLLPVGDAWRDALRDPQAALYGPDNFHPTRAGSELAARVIVRALLAPQNPALR